MYCRRCKIKMCEERRSFHKKRKWICPRCHRARMQAQRDKSRPHHKD